MFLKIVSPYASGQADLNKGSLIPDYQCLKKILLVEKISFNVFTSCVQEPTFSRVTLVIINKTGPHLPNN